MSKTDDITLQRAAETYQDFMNLMGIPMDANSEGTAMRVARMFYNEKCLALHSKPPKITTFPNEGVDQYVVVRDIPYFSICAHHHVSFSGVAHIVYHPSDRIAGLSKFARVVKHFAAKPQIQEILTQEIAEYLFKELSPIGLAVRLEGKHLCMEERGIQAVGSRTVTQKFLGQIDKEEVATLIGGKCSK